MTSEREVVEATISAVIEVATKKVLEAITALRRSGAAKQVAIRSGATANELGEHLRLVKSWSDEIAFKGLLKSKSLREHFLNVDCDLGHQEAPAGKSRRGAIKVSELVTKDRHCVLLGRPGAGKTTSMKRIAQIVLDRRARGRADMLVLIRLRDLNPRESVLDRLLSTLSIEMSFGVDVKRPDREEWQRRAATAALESIGALVLLDGLDEVPESKRAKVERQVEALFLNARSHRFILTCRTGAYRRTFSRSDAFVLLPLSRTQVQRFASSWLAQGARKFVEQLYASPFAGVEVLPLTLAYLCAVYERTGQIPAKPKSVYQRIVRLLLEEWDEENGTRRESRYAEFDVDRKSEFLRSVSYHLTLDGVGATFSHAELERAYKAIHQSFGLPFSEMTRVARELESHSGLIVFSSGEQYEFAHKSIQEFLCAEYLLRLPTVPFARLGDFAEELAVATALSSNSNAFLEEMFVALENPRGLRAGSFLPVFARRLAAERPDFRVSASLGWVVLGMAQMLASDAKSHRSRSEAIRVSDLSDLFAIRDLWHSAARARSAATVFAREDGRHIVGPTTDSGSVLPQTRRYFERLKDRGVLIEAAALTLLDGWSPEGERAFLAEYTHARPVLD